MALLDRLKRNNSLELAENKTIPSSLSSEVGVAGEVVFTGMKDEEARTDRISIDNYIKMLDTDDTIQALYSILTLPIIATSYRINADENDAGETQADLIRNNLLEPPHKGGMETPFDLFLLQLMRAFLEGFQLFERVYKVKDGKIIINRLAHRDSRTLTLKRDKTGGFGGAVQRVSYNGEYKDISIDAYKCFLFTYGKEHSYLYGRSAFKAAYVNYDKKRRLEYLDSISLQNDAIKAKYLTRTNAAEVDTKDAKSARNKALAALAKLGETKPVAAIPYGYELNVIDSNGRDAGPSIERQNAGMARSVLAQFILLGTQGKSNVGSFALSESSADIFKIALKGTMQNIENHINNYLIPDLIDYNFADPHYPEFHFDDLTSDVMKVMTDAFMKLVEKDRISDEMVKGIEDATASRLEIDRERIKKEMERQAKKEAKKNTPDTPPQDPVVETNNLSEDMEQQWWRPLTPAEKTIKLVDLNKRMNDMEANFIATISPILDDVIKNLHEDMIDKKPSDVVVTLPKEYAGAILATLKTSYNYAKTGAADELKVNAPATTKEAIANMQELTNFIIEKQQDDLKNLIKAEILKERRTQHLAENDPEQTEPTYDFDLALAAALTAWVAAITAPLASSVVAHGVNSGRNDVFNAVSKEGDVFQYSAILDTKVCPTCKDLDSRVVDKNGYQATIWKPQIHFNCRCIWVLIQKLAEGKIDTDLPKVTGMPAEAGGKTGPSL